MGSRVLTAIIGVASLSATIPLATLAEESAPRAFRVEWRSQRLAIDANHTPLRELLQAVAARTGMKIRGLELLKGSATFHRTGLTASGAIQALLPDTNYLLTLFGDSGLTLTITSDRSPEALAEAAVAHAGEHSREALAGAGYVPKPYRKLYHWAHHGDWPELLEAASKGDPATQSIALRLLSQRRPEQAAEVAASISRGAESSNRLNGVQALREIDSPVSVAALGAALDDPDLGVRHAAVLGLVGQTSPEAIRWLGQALRDEDSSIRTLALELLEQKGSDGASSIGIALESPDPALRERARKILEQLSAAE